LVARAIYSLTSNAWTCAAKNLGDFMRVWVGLQAIVQYV